MTGDDGPWWFHGLDRRELLTAVGTAAAATSAGCSETLVGGGQNESDAEDEATPTTTDFGYGGTPRTATTTTTDFGYGGTPRTATPTADGTVPATATQTTTSETTATTGPGTTTGTDSTTAPAGPTTSGTPRDTYGVQGYGQYGYGG